MSLKKLKVLMAFSIFFLSYNVEASSPAQPILPSDNIQDPGALSTPWGGCTPTDANCYVVTSGNSSFSENVTGLDYSTSTGILSLNSAYIIPTFASTTAWNNLLASSTNNISKNGNSFGTVLAIGTNDSNSLSFKTNNTNQLTIATNGNITINNGTLGGAGWTIDQSGNFSGRANTAVTASSSDVATRAGSILGTAASNFGGYNVSNIGALSATSLALTNGLSVASGGTGTSSFPSGRVLFGNGTSAINSTSILFWDNVNERLGIGTTAPGSLLTVAGTGQFTGLTTFDSGINVNGETFTDLIGSGLYNSSGALTVSGLSTSHFASANISQWTNDSGYITTESDTLQSVTDRGTVTTNSIEASSFVVTGANSGQFLKGDGTLDSTTYLDTGIAASVYVPYTGASGNIDLGNHELKAKKIGIGSVTPGGLRGIFDIQDSYLATIGDVTASDPTLYINYSSGAYNAFGYTYTYYIYAYKTVGATQIFSSTPYTFSNTDDSSLNAYYMTATWDAVAGADGYRVIVSDPAYGASGDYYFDTPYNAFQIGGAAVGYEDNSLQFYSFGSTVTPSSAVTGDVDLYVNGTGDLITAKDIKANVYKALTGGSAAAPVFSFDSYSNTGMYTDGSSLSFSIGGTSALQLAANAVTLPFNQSLRFTSLGGASVPIITPAGDTDTGLWFPAADTYAVSTAGIERYRINSSGNMGLGTGSSVSARLDITSTTEQLRLGYDGSNYWKNAVNSTGGLTMQGVGTGGSLTLFPTAGKNVNLTLSGTGDFAVNTNQLYVDTSLGNVGIGTTTPTQKLSVIGNAQFTGVGSGAYGFDLNLTSTGVLTTSASDQRLKDNIMLINSSTTLEKINQLKPSTFTWKADGSHDLGLIAQEVQTIFPELVFTNPSDGYLGINYSRFTPLLISAIQELSHKVDAMFAWFKDGKFNVQSDVCVDDVCVTKDQFKNMLRNAGAQQASVVPVVVTSPATPTENNATPTDGVVTPPAPEVNPTPVVEPTPEPTPAPVEPVVETPAPASE